MPTLEELQRRAQRAKAKPGVVRERDVEGKVKDYARKRGLWVRKFKSQNNMGVPDDIFATANGTVFFIEFKAPGKPCRPTQIEEHRVMREHSLRVYVIDNVGEGCALIDAILDDDIFGS